jgi:hypothetical protein
VVDKIESKILRNQFVLGVFLDIEGAFDHLSPGGVNASMVARGFPEEVTNWYGHYLENREVQIELRGTKLTRHLTRGSSQGGVISPTAWNVNFESLLKILDHGPATSVGYADDAVMLLAGSDPDLLIDRAQPYLVKALQWGNDNGLTFSSSKTVAVMFTRKKWNTEKTLIMDGSIIEFSNQVKYLGLTLTSDLSWSTHINNKIKSCKWKLMQLRAAVGIRWGPRPDLMAWAYKGIILPVLTYGALVWAHRKIPDYLVSRLTKLNRLAAMGLGPMRRNSPTAGLEIILDFQPLDLVVKGEGLKAFGRLKNNEHLRTVWDGLGRPVNGHRRSWADLAASSNISLPEEDKCALAFNWAPPFSFLSDRVNMPSMRVFVAATCSEHAAAVGIVAVISVNQSYPGRICTVSGHKLMGSSTTTALLAAIISCCRGLGADDLASGVNFCVRAVPASLCKPFVATKTALDCIAAIRDTGKVSFSQPCNLWEKVMVKKALKAAELAIVGEVWDLVAPPHHQKAQSH